MRARPILLSTAIFGIALAALVRFADGPGAEPIARILTLGMLGVVPLVLLVLPSPSKTWDRLLLVAAAALPLCGASAVVSLWLPAGMEAAPYTAPWMGLALLVASLGAARAFSEGGLKRVDRMASAISLAYLPVGAGWLVMARMGLEPMGFDPAIVVLTAVHFHFAALAAPAMAVRAIHALEGGERKLAMASAISIVAAIPVVAAGFTTSPVVGLVGAVMLAAGMIAVAGLMVFRIQPRLKSRAARVLMVISAVSVTFSMPLAVYYQYGQWAGVETIDLLFMVRFHGFANAHGFATCGLLAWVIEDRRAESAKGPSAVS